MRAKSMVVDEAMSDRVEVPDDAPSIRPENPQNSGVDLVSCAANLPEAPPLSPMTQQLLAAGVAEATSRARRADVADWAAFMSERGQPAAPVAAEAIADYVTRLLTAGSASVKTPRPLAIGTVERRVASVSAWSTECGHGRVDLSQARRVIRGFRRTTGAAQHLRAAPITVEILRVMLEQLDADEAAGLVARATRDRALLTTAYCLAARRSEVVALNIEDVSFVEQGAVVRVLRRKTRELPDEVAVPWATDPRVCAVKALQKLIDSLGGQKSGPLFRRITRSGIFLPAALQPESVADVVARVTKEAGIEPPQGYRGFSGHSLRRGAVSAMRDRGADVFAIARAGGWSSNSRVLGGYLDDADKWRSSPLQGLL